MVQGAAATCSMKTSLPPRLRTRWTSCAGTELDVAVLARCSALSRRLSIPPTPGEATSGTQPLLTSRTLRASGTEQRTRVHTTTSAKGGQEPSAGRQDVDTGSRRTPTKAFVREGQALGLALHCLERQVAVEGTRGRERRSAARGIPSGGRRSTKDPRHSPPGRLFPRILEHLGIWVQASHPGSVATAWGGCGGHSDQR